MNEVAIRCGRPLRGVVLADPSVPLPPPAPPPPRPAAPDPAAILAREQQAVAVVLAQLRQAAAQITAQYEVMRGQMQKAAVEMAIAIAGRLLHERLQANDFAVEKLARQLIAPLAAAPSVSVSLHPEDLELLRHRLGESPLLPSGTPELRLHADPGLSRGSCRAEAQGVQVLSDMAGQLADLRQHLLWSAGDAEAQSPSSAL